MFYEHTAYQDSQFYLYRQIQRANFPLLQREYNVVKKNYSLHPNPHFLFLWFCFCPLTPLHFYDISPCCAQFFKGPCRICRACGRQRDCLHACQRKLIFLIKCPCFISVCNDLLYIGCGKNFPYICRFDVFDAVVARTLDITALYHIPYGYVVFKQHIFLLIYRLRHRFIQQIRKQLPKTVLLVSVIEIVFP